MTEGERGDDGDRNRGTERENAGRQLLVEHPKFTSLLRHPVVLNSCTVKRSGPLLSSDRHTRDKGTVKSQKL